MATALRVPLYPAEQAAKPSTCCVTGASGYVGSALVRRLLAAGHTVHGTVRAPDDPAKTSHLRTLPGADSRLRLFAADLTKPGSFDAAVSGCRYIFHTASPFDLNVPRAQVDDRLVRPAVSGVEAALGAVESAGRGSVEAVILTSSIVAMTGDNWEHGKDHALSETDWNASSTADHGPYAYSKTLAERRAWELYKNQAGEEEVEGQGRWRMATVNPGFVLGPPLALTGGESMSFAQQMVEGRFRAGVPRVYTAIVDVEDVAAAHVLAALNPSSDGQRYLCAAETIDFVELVKGAEAEAGGGRRWAGRGLGRRLLWVVCNVFRVLPWDALSGGVDRPFTIDNSKIKRELGMQFISPAKTLADMGIKVEELEAAKKA